LLRGLKPCISRHSPPTTAENPRQIRNSAAYSRNILGSPNSKDSADSKDSAESLVACHLKGFLVNVERPIKPASAPNTSGGPTTVGNAAEQSREDETVVVELLTGKPALRLIYPETSADPPVGAKPQRSGSDPSTRSSEAGHNLYRCRAYHRVGGQAAVKILRLNYLPPLKRFPSDLNRRDSQRVKDERFFVH
jgi:hypothetical protein